MAPCHAPRASVGARRSVSAKSVRRSTHEGDWWVVRDGLLQWWHPVAQEHAKKIGLFKHQLRSMGATNAGTKYAETVPGDQHTFSPLDDNLFARFKKARGDHTNATFDLKRDDPLKFSMATTTLGESTFERVWKVQPTDAHIIANIDRWPKAVQRILDNKGMLVEKSTAVGHRKAQAYLPALHPDARTAITQSESRFGSPTKRQIT